MTPQTRTSLKELQNLDQEIAVVRAARQSFEPLLEEVDEPVLRLEPVSQLEQPLQSVRCHHQNPSGQTRHPQQR